MPSKELKGTIIPHMRCTRKAKPRAYVGLSTGRIIRATADTPYASHTDVNRYATSIYRSSAPVETNRSLLLDRIELRACTHCAFFINLCQITKARLRMFIEVQRL